MLEKRGLRKLVAAGTVPAGNLPQTRLATPIHKTSEAAEQVATPAELTNTQPAPGTQPGHHRVWMEGWRQRLGDTQMEGGGLLVDAAFEKT